MPKVSVIIPIYGTEKFIQRCARSLFNQTLDDIEYIFINDCTPYRSLDLLQDVIYEFPDRKQQIIIENMSMNSGLPAVRKHGIKIATGEYIIHCDSDDWVDVTMYKEMYNEAKLKGYDIISCDYYCSNGNQHIYKKCAFTYNDNKLSDLLSHRTAVSVCNKLVKKELYHNDIIYPTHNMGEDYALVIQLAIHATNWGHINKPFYYYYFNNNSISNDQNQEKVINKWVGLNKNILLISNCLKKHDLYVKYKVEIEEEMFKYREYLTSFILLDKKYREIWLNLYPDLNFWSEKGLKYKLRYLIIYFGLYPLLHKLKSYIR